MTFSTAAAPGALPGYPQPRQPLGPDALLVARSMDTLRATGSGREVADFLQRQHVSVQVLPDAEYAQRHPDSGASYDPKTRLVVTPRSALRDPAIGATTLAHEGQHALDFHDRPAWYVDSVGMMAGTSGDALRALVSFDNPMTAWLDSLTARQNGFEVTAYRRQAAVASELGLNQSAWSHGQARDGSVLSKEETRADIATSALYRMSPTRRLVLGGGLGLAVTSSAALGAGALAGRLAKGSYLAAHTWPVYAVGGAMTAAWLLADQIRAHRLEGQRAARPAVAL